MRGCSAAVLRCCRVWVDGSVSRTAGTRSRLRDHTRADYGPARGGPGATYERGGAWPVWGRLVFIEQCTQQAMGGGRPRRVRARALGRPGGWRPNGGAAVTEAFLPRVGRGHLDTPAITPADP